MTEIDTSHGRIEHLRSIGCADYLHMALLDRAEKAEDTLRQMRDAIAELEGLGPDWPHHGNIPLAIVSGYALHKNKRDSAWNDAIEAALKHRFTEGGCGTQVVSVDDLRALRKGADDDH